jgi:hypothetical protein
VTPEANTRSQSPSVIASQLGLLRSNPGSGGRMVTWDALLDTAVDAYIAKAHEAGRPIRVERRTAA